MLCSRARAREDSGEPNQSRSGYSVTALLKKSGGAPGASQGLISVLWERSPPGQQLRCRAAATEHSAVTSGLCAPGSYSSPWQGPGGFCGHPLRAQHLLGRETHAPIPPATLSGLTTGRLRCSSFRRIQSFSSTSRLEAEYTARERAQRGHGAQGEGEGGEEEPPSLQPRDGQGGGAPGQPHTYRAPTARGHPRSDLRGEKRG